MDIISYFQSERQSELLNQIAACDWSAAKFLVSLLREGRFYEMLGSWGQIYLLMDGDELISFLTLTGQDAVRDESLTPWIGFVFTQPAYRGHRYAGLLLSHAECIAAQSGYRRVYIATDHIGLYEKYGYEYQQSRIDYWGNEMRVLCKDL